MIALVTDGGVPWFTTGETTRPAFLAEGCKPFSFRRRGAS